MQVDMHYYGTYALALAAGFPNIRAYDWKEGEHQKHDFVAFGSSEKGTESNCYRFHQAATYHRYYMLKDLLPSQGIAVF